MAAKAGLKPFETDSLAPCDVWLTIDGYDQRERMEWERTRVICFNVAKFGNSDPNKFPNTPNRFWPLPWDEKEKRPEGRDILAHHAKMKAIREQFEKNKE